MPNDIKNRHYLNQNQRQAITITANPDAAANKKKQNRRGRNRHRDSRVPSFCAQSPPSMTKRQAYPIFVVPSSAYRKLLKIVTCMGNPPPPRPQHCIQ